MDILVCIDDTDNLESKGTGAIAQELIDLIETNGIGKGGIITRHQLFLHDDIPYTSHNSSMCFDCSINPDSYDILIDLCTNYLESESAPGSDPGISIAIKSQLDSYEPLINFGFRAKKAVLTKKDAYNLANTTGIFLQEKGGTGDGVIGALAGIGLRLSKNDGEIKGGLKEFLNDNIYSIKEMKRVSVLEQVLDIDLNEIQDDELVYIQWKAKPIMTNGLITLILQWSKDKNTWTTMDKNQLRTYENHRIYQLGCENFIFDVMEERIDQLHTCYNCKYRRWLKESIMCMNKNINL